MKNKTTYVRVITLLLMLTFLASPFNSFSQKNLKSNEENDSLVNIEDIEWDDFFMPGVGYKFYLPRTSESLGEYHGVSTEFVFYARAKGYYSDRSGPARIKSYGNFSILNTTKKDQKDMLHANIGVNLSLEGRTDRKVFLPYFGAEIGGLFHGSFSAFQLSPKLGIQLISTKTVVWNLQGGYNYSMKNFDDYSGYMASSTLNLLLWNN